MPRKQRIEFPGAIYHVISRGNYRKELFLSEGSGERFESTIFEAVERCGWRLHAYVIMKNHYHLALETPQPNLVFGMKWLQSTFATRFNRFHHEQGHVFQGRYKSILIGDDRSLPGLVDYIHLNPVRAGISDIDHLKNYTLSSYPKFWNRKSPVGLCRAVYLSLLGFPDNQAGMRRYRHHLETSESAVPDQRNVLAKRFCRGWFIGPAEQRKALAVELAAEYSENEWIGTDLAELNEAKWEALVVEQIQRAGKSDEDLQCEKKGVDWKVAIARVLRRETTAPNPWIAERLCMGHPSRVCNMIRGG